MEVEIQKGEGKKKKETKKAYFFVKVIVSFVFQAALFMLIVLNFKKNHWNMQEWDPAGSVLCLAMVTDNEFSNTELVCVGGSRLDFL